MTHRPSPRKPPVPSSQRSYFGVRWLCHRFYGFNPTAKIRPVAQPFLSTLNLEGAALFSSLLLLRLCSNPLTSQTSPHPTLALPAKTPRRNLLTPFLFDVRNFQPAASSAHPSLYLLHRTSGIQVLPSPGVEGKGSRCKLSGLTARCRGLARELGENEGVSGSEIQARYPDLRSDLQVTMRKALPLPVPLPSNLLINGIFSPSSARQNPRPEPGGHAALRRTTRSHTSGKTSRHADCRRRHIIPLDQLSGWLLRGRT
jgi:hypothetical protein